jgi:hypothetical protein
MSDNANRSFELITLDDLARLAQLALANFEAFFVRNPTHPYKGKLRLICLIQTAAKHYVDPDKCIEAEQRWGGVNDFDVFGFFEAVAGRPLFAQRKCKLDFGPSKFGRNPNEGERFEGRHVDVMWRSIDVRTSESPIESVQRYLQDAPTLSSAKNTGLQNLSSCLAQRGLGSGYLARVPSRLTA